MESLKLEHEYNADNSLGDSLKNHFLSLTNFILKDLKLNLEPLPKIILVNNDVENSKLILGKTAEYAPNEMVIRIYTLNRHPKDILRSFAHEMIHHNQYIENRTPEFITTNNINEDDVLAELEREAYEKGNMAFRMWENNCKK